jgi:hypothetical protein
MKGKPSDFQALRWLSVVFLSLLWTTMGSAAALAERRDFGHSTLAAKTTVQQNNAAGDAWEADIINNQLPATQTGSQPAVSPKSLSNRRDHPVS